MQKWSSASFLACAAVFCALRAATASIPANAQQITSEDSVAIYTAALKMFDPPQWPMRRQVRWLDARFFSPAKDPGDSIPPSLLEDILMRVGERFEPLPESIEADPREGGIVRISMLRLMSNDTATVVAQYIHRTKYHTGPMTNMTLSIIRNGSQWRLVSQ